MMIPMNCGAHTYLCEDDRRQSLSLREEFSADREVTGDEILQDTTMGSVCHFL